ncbi:transcriptional repressor [Propionibacterium phage PFR2]|uniref:Uncharacterized protein n=3 Tax=root TaxID=1 RepID=A0A173G9H2_9CAUD|nr:transcriptional repressor [Propionibacterium phage PFR1]YP_009290938.1 transcriptional repressor [Propionibacterium phage PFR2]ANH49895.1 hypothetical protein PFR_29 [Propionibacterium phage PFR1]ANH49954.1 hypothetical protein PFR2_29 [Propionibacterium phage PFR2]SCQ46816.1 Hypothetical protein PFR_JS7-1_1866 [Propionibacterium freudenreichii]
MSQIERKVIHMNHMTPTAVELSATLRRALREAGVSQRELSERFGIPLTTLNRHLSRGVVSWDEIRAVSIATNRSAASLVAETSEQQEVAA